MFTLTDFPADVRALGNDLWRRPTDLRAIGASTVLLILAAIIASYVPARRALRIDPIVALRTE